jgi:hypothetical protein
MPVTSTNLIQGPATLYVGTFGLAEPLTVSAAPAAGWIDVGGTSGGVELNISSEYANLTVDQIIDIIESRRTGREVTVKTSLAEATLDNLARAIGNAAPAANVLNLDDNAAAFKPPYSAILIDGIAPGGFRRRIVVRKTIPTDAVGMSYKKDDQTLLPVTWRLHWVSSSITPLKIEDATS